MKMQNFEKIAIKVHNARQWLARRTPRQRLIRRELGRKSELKWWLVYGPPRTGTSYMMRLIKTRAALYINDWSLGWILDFIPGWLEFKSVPFRDYIAFDHNRFLRDISNNIVDNAYAGDGNQLDLVYKQVVLRPNEYQALVKMWGLPERIIFCLREPAGYIASAAKKFLPNAPLEQVQDMYVTAIKNYPQVKGDIFEYTPELSVSDYISFLKPLNLKGKRLPSFQYTGEQDHEKVSEEMWNAYHRMKALVTE